ncbi:MAG: hypothetical protein RLZZ563_2007, partial [Pseudomonadota bacterium]
MRYLAGALAFLQNVTTNDVYCELRLGTAA